jgi:hypothetical protein
MLVGPVRIYSASEPERCRSHLLCSASAPARLLPLQLSAGKHITHLLPLPQAIMCLVYPLPFRDVVPAVEAGKRDAMNALLDAPKRRPGFQ